MAPNRDLPFPASQSARAFVGMMPLALLAGALTACQSPEPVNTNPRMFVAVNMPPLRLRRRWRSRHLRNERL
jgi:hypothetical protein